MYGTGMRVGPILATDREVRSRMYLSPDSISRTRRLGSSERRAARTQPAVPIEYLVVWGLDGDNGKLASSYDDHVVLRLKQLLAGDAIRANSGREVPEIFEERFLRGSFCCLEEEKSRDDSDEGEVGILSNGRGHGCVRAGDCGVLPSELRRIINIMHMCNPARAKYQPGHSVLGIQLSIADL